MLYKILSRKGQEAQRAPSIPIKYLFPACPWVKADWRNKAETLGRLSTLYPRYQIRHLPFMLLVKIKFGMNVSILFLCQLSSVQFSHSVISDSLWSHGLQHARLPCSSPTHSQSLLDVHRVGDAIQPSYPLSSPSPTFNFSQQQGPFKWVSSLHQVDKVLEFQLQHESFQWIFRTYLL